MFRGCRVSHTAARQIAATRRHRRRIMALVGTNSAAEIRLPSCSAVRNMTGLIQQQPIIQPHRYIHTSQFQLDSAKVATEAAASTEPADTAASSESKQYSTPELTHDAALHKAALNDPDRPNWQNPLIHKATQAEDFKTYREDFASEEEFQKAVIPAPPLDLGDGAPPTPEYLNALADEIVNLTVLEMNELVNKMAEHYGFNEGMLSPDDAAAADDVGHADEPQEKPVEQTAFDVKLTGFDAASKIKIIKEVRAIANLGLKEAKEFVEGAPKVIQKGLKKEQAEEIKAKLEAVGATVEIV